MCVYIQVEVTVELQWSYSNSHLAIEYKDKKLKGRKYNYLTYGVEVHYCLFVTKINESSEGGNRSEEERGEGVIER